MRIGILPMSRNGCNSLGYGILIMAVEDYPALSDFKPPLIISAAKIQFIKQKTEICGNYLNKK